MIRRSRLAPRRFSRTATSIFPSGALRTAACASGTVCGIVFWLMALPGLVILVAGRFTAGREMTDASGSGWVWLGLYVALLVVGWWLGTVTINAWS